MNELLNKFNIKTNNLDIYETAFTHSSYAVKQELPLDYERLEFLGDSILNMFVSDILFKMHPNFGEGKLTKIRANYVCQQALIFYSHKFGLDQYVKLDFEDSYLTKNEVLSITADVFESFLGAIYLDQGFDTVKKFLIETIYPYIKQKLIFFYDYKSSIKEYGDANEVKVDYELLEEKGLPHNKTFKMCILIDGEQYGTGVGKNKKDAEQLAAKEAISKLNIESK
ncbi:ribonuclease III [Methanobrevibacter sp. UBA412]|jgi:ribonuclease-3|uniref:ribonuclease III n=1 Tax=Methanobrevibacter sp. UBA412 TaxID=1915486 RepID=UPI0039B83FE2